MNLRYIFSLFYSLSYTLSLYIYYGWPFGPAKDTLAARGRPYLVVAYGHNLIKSFDSNGRIRTRRGAVNGDTVNPRLPLATKDFKLAQWASQDML